MGGRRRRPPAHGSRLIVHKALPNWLWGNIADFRNSSDVAFAVRRCEQFPVFACYRVSLD